MYGKLAMIWHFTGYSITSGFPKVEMFCLVSQMRRAAVSVTSNIAEVFSRNSNKDKSQFYYISLGSLKELKNQFILSKDLGYLDKKCYENFCEKEERVGKMLNGLIKSIRNIS